MHERDVFTQERFVGEIGDHTPPGAPRIGVDVDAQALLPGDRPLAGDPVEIHRPRQDGPERDAGRRSGRLGEAPVVSVLDEHGAQRGIGVGLERGFSEALLGSDE